MAIIKINVRNVISSGNATVSAKSALSGARSGISSVKNQLDSRICSSNNIGSRMNNLTSKISSAENRITRLRSVVEKCANSYQDTDDRLKRKADSVKDFKFNNRGSSAKKVKDGLTLKKLDKNHNWFEIGLNRRYESGDKKLIGMSLFDIKSGDDYFRAFGYEFNDGLKKWFNNKSISEYVAKIGLGGFVGYLGKKALELKSELNSGINGFFFKDLEKKLEDKAENKGYRKDLYDDEKYYDEDGKEISKEEAGFLDRQATILEHKKEVSASKSLFDGEYDYGSGKVSATMGEAEAHASASGGFYVVGNDGKKRFSPGVSAEVGVSVTALEAEWNQQWLGNEQFGLNSDVGVTIGKAGAEASGQVQIFGDDGKVNLQANVEAKAEAIAAEAEGSIGLNVLGGEVGVKGSVNVGVGAHAEIGVKDGVVKCDIGASLGVGFSFGFEVDVGGMVDSVTDIASSAWNGIKGWFS